MPWFLFHSFVHRIQKGQALVEFEEMKSSKSCVEFTQVSHKSVYMYFVFIFIIYCFFFLFKKLRFGWLKGSTGNDFFKILCLFGWKWLVTITELYKKNICLKKKIILDAKTIKKYRCTFSSQVKHLLVLVIQHSSVWWFLSLRVLCYFDIGSSR